MRGLSGNSAIGFRERMRLETDSWNVDNPKELVGVCLDPNISDLPQGIDKQYVSVIWATLLYCAWNFRNGKLFGSRKMMDKAIFDFERMVEEMSGQAILAREKGFLTETLRGLFHGHAP